jgi:hypothetical protein
MPNNNDILCRLTPAHGQQATYFKLDLALRSIPAITENPKTI